MDEDFKELRRRQMDEYLEKERQQIELNMDKGMVPDSNASCPQRIGIRFAPAMETEKLVLLANFVCEERGAPLLRSVGEACWGCPDCGLRVGFAEADILAGASVRGLHVLRGSMRRKWKWPWQHWFRSKRASISSKT